MMAFIKKNWLIFLTIIIWFISYSQVPYLFFQQDELFGFGLFILKGSRIILSGLELHDAVHFVPVTMSLSYFIYLLFNLKPEVYNIVGLFFHTFNGVLVYLLIQRILKNKLYSFLSVILFFSSSAAAELVMWPVINLNTISLTFSLFALYWLVRKEQERGYLKVFDSILISVLFLLAIFSVEYAAGMILLIPLVAIILGKNKTIFKVLCSLIPFFIAVSAYLVLRFVSPILFQQSTVLVSEKGLGLFDKFLWLLSLPFIYFAQIFFGEKILIDISQFFSSSIFGNTTNTQFAESMIYKYVAFFVGLVIVTFIIWIIKVTKKVDLIHTKYLIIFLSLIIFSSLPFILVPGKAFSIFPSRYLYFGSVGYALIVPTILYILKRIKLKKEAVIFLLFIVAAIIFGTAENFQRGTILYKTGKTRELILEDIKNTYPILSRKVIFYTESSKSYYGLPDEDKIFPFQSGLGQTLLLWYYKSENFPTSFFKDNFLWDITSQGYKEIQDRGFGYFRDYSLLIKTLKEYNLPSESIIAFSWDGKTNTLTDITEKIRKEVNLNVKKLNY